MNLAAVPIDTSGGLVDHLKNVPDPRMKRGVRHRMLSVLTVAVSAILSGAKSFVAIGEWAQRTDQEMRKRMGCRFHKQKKLFVAPSEPSLRRAIQGVDAVAVDNAINAWLLQQTPSGGNALAIDGKTSRGSMNRHGNKTHLLSAFLYKQGVVVAQQAVDAKSNEITAVRPLLADLDTLKMESFPLSTRRPTKVTAGWKSAGSGPVASWTATLISPTMARWLRIERVTQHVKSGKERREVVFGITSLSRLPSGFWS